MHPPTFPLKPTDALQVIRDHARDHGWSITEREIERANQISLMIGGQEAVFNVFHNGKCCILRSPDGNQEMEDLLALLKARDLIVTSTPGARLKTSIHLQAHIAAASPTPNDPIRELDQMISILRNKAPTAAAFLWGANESYCHGTYLACSVCLGLSTKSLVQALVQEISQSRDVRSCIGETILDPINPLASLRNAVSTSRSRPASHQQLMAVIDLLDELVTFGTPWLDPEGNITLPEFHDQSALRTYAIRRCLHMQQAIDGVMALLGS